MLLYTSEYVAKLNENYRGGIFVRAVDFEEDPVNGLFRYWVDYPEPLTFDGHTYLPLHMVWGPIKTSQSMNIDGATIGLSGYDTVVQAIKYIKQIDVTENLVILRVLHMDLLNQLTGHWRRDYEVQNVQADISLVTFSIGRRLGRSVLPRKVYLQKDFPGLSSEQVKIFG